MQAYYRVYELPWSVSAEDEKRFRTIAKHTAGVLVAMCVVMPLLPVFESGDAAQPELPPRVAQLVIERKAPPPPPPPTPEPEVAEQPPEVVPEPVPVVEPEPTPVVQPEVRETPRPDRVAEAREKASNTGVMAFADQLAELREHAAVDVAGSRNLGNAVGASERSERSLVTSAAGRASGGINTASMSRDTGGTGLAGRSTTQVDAPIGDLPKVAAASDAGSPREQVRSREEIEMIFDQNKGAIYALYRRALRADPTLEGKLVLRLTIAPDGQVVDCEVVSSELGAPELERKLVQRVKLFNFGPRDVGVITTTKPIEFFPA